MDRLRVGCMTMAAAATAAAAVTFITSPVAKLLVLLLRKRPTNAREGGTRRTKSGGDWIVCLSAGCT